MMEINNQLDVIDSRDVIARIKDLRLDERNDDEAAELHVLEALAAEAEGSPDWGHGELLIRDTYFEEHAQNLAEDCGMLPNSPSWPNYCIDWEYAARELKHDYTAVDFGGVRYWIWT